METKCNAVSNKTFNKYCRICYIDNRSAVNPISVSFGSYVPYFVLVFVGAFIEAPIKLFVEQHKLSAFLVCGSSRPYN